MTRRVWTFRLAGGSAFRGTINIPNAFPVRIDHPGEKSLTVCSLRLSDGEATEMEAMLRMADIRVTRWSVEETPDQRQIRDRVRASADLELPTVKCPGCFWLDVEGDDPCGAVGWDPVVRHEAVEAHPRAQADLQSCPLYGNIHNHNP